MEQITDRSSEATYGPNPLKKLRQKYGLSQAQLADLAGISPQAVLKYEQGLYQDPSDSIMSALISTASHNDEHISWSKLADEYQQWRLIHQAAQRWRFEDIRHLNIHGNEHPFASLRRAVGDSKKQRGLGVSVQGFAVILALHPATCSEYNSGRLRSMPSVMKEALLRAGCRMVIIDEVDTFGQYYYDRKNKSA